MNYKILMYFHLLTIVPCVFLGAYLLIVQKGTGIHKLLGKIYMVLMLITATLTLFMPAQVGPNLFGHFGFLHLFSVLTIYTVPSSLLAIKKGDVAGHKRGMFLLYFGAIVIAGGFTFVPGRFLYEFFFN